MRLTVSSIAVGLACMASLCHADELPQAPGLTIHPPVPPQQMMIDVPATVDQGLAVHFGLGTFSGTFNQTPLPAILPAANSGAVAPLGDDAAAYWICYTYPTIESRSRLWLVTDAPGGKSAPIDEIDIGEDDTGHIPGNAACPVLPRNLQPGFIDDGLWIGMKRGEVLDKLGDPSRKEGDWLIYKHAGTTANGRTETGLLAIRLHKGVVEFIHARRTLSD